MALTDSQVDTHWLNAEDLTILSLKYGQKNVENTMIYISGQLHPKTDLQVNIPYTIDRVEKILDAVHGEYLHG